MTQGSPKQLARAAGARIERIRDALAGIDYLCSGTLLERTKVCGKLVHRQVSAEQAELLRQAIDNHRYAQQLLRDWNTETEQLVDAELPRTR